MDRACARPFPCLFVVSSGVVTPANVHLLLADIPFMDQEDAVDNDLCNLSKGSYYDFELITARDQTASYIR